MGLCSIFQWELTSGAERKLNGKEYATPPLHSQQVTISWVDRNEPKNTLDVNLSQLGTQTSC